MKKLNRLIVWFGVLLVGAAVAQEMRKPPEERTWNGRVGGVVPYDFRVPTVDTVKVAYWDPENPHILTDRVLGVGWGINLPVLGQRLFDVSKVVAGFAQQSMARD
jgi:hypothetical protein